MNLKSSIEDQKVTIENQKNSIANLKSSIENQRVTMENQKNSNANLQHCFTEVQCNSLFKNQRLP